MVKENKHRVHQVNGLTFIVLVFGQCKFYVYLGVPSLAFSLIKYAVFELLSEKAKKKNNNKLAYLWQKE